MLSFLSTFISLRIFIARKIAAIIYLGGGERIRNRECVNKTNKRIIEVFVVAESFVLKFFAMWVIEGDKI